MSFQDMGLRGEILQAIEEIEYTTPTPIQSRAIPMVLSGQDLMCCAQTGTGKTAAFALPILQRLSEKPKAPLRALVLVPTRELAIQVGQSFRDYGRHLDLITTTVFGGVPIEPQEKMLRHGVDILVATPGRLIDHTWRGNIDYRNTEFLVLDEADRMLDMGFIKDVREIVGMVREERQSMLFSATLDREIVSLSRDMLKDPVRIEVAPPATTLEKVEQRLIAVDRRGKRSTLESLIRDHQMTRTIVFVRTKSGATTLSRQLREHGFRASAMHGDRSQSERVRTLEDFRAGRVDLLVATDIAARGIDIDDVSHVVNYDLPYSAGDYVHRIGRTARAGREGTALSLVTPEDSTGLSAIERLIGQKIPWLGEAAVFVPKEPRDSGRSPRHRRGTGNNARTQQEARPQGRRAPAAPREQKDTKPAAPRGHAEGAGTRTARERSDAAGRERQQPRDRASAVPSRTRQSGPPQAPARTRDGSARREDRRPQEQARGRDDDRRRGTSPRREPARTRDEARQPVRVVEKKAGILQSMVGRLKNRLLSTPAPTVAD